MHMSGKELIHMNIKICSVFKLQRIALKYAEAGDLAIKKHICYSPSFLRFYPAVHVAGKAELIQIPWLAGQSSSSNPSGQSGVPSHLNTPSIH